VLTLSARLAELQKSDPATPSTPSSQIPPFNKANTANKRHKTPGRKTSHQGVRRKPPSRIDRTLKLRGHDPIETIVSALRHYLSHKFTLPPLLSINIPSDM